jgi:hypothetical protein
MIRQEMTVCQKCGALKEMGEPCDCPEEEKNEDEWWRFNTAFTHGVTASPYRRVILSCYREQ